MGNYSFTIHIGGASREEVESIARQAERFVMDEQEHAGMPGYVCGGNVEDTVTEVEQ